MKARIPKDLLPHEIENLYCEYCNFLNVELPKFEFEYFKDDYVENFAQVIYPKDSTEKFKLFVSKSIMSQDIKSRRNILFHEFTHIWDATRILPDNFSNAKYELIEAYSEINASKIEIMSAFEFQSVRSEIFVMLKDNIHIDNNEISLSDWIALRSIVISDLQTQFVKSKSSKDFLKLYKEVLYYIGYLKFCNCYCREKIDFCNSLDFIDIEIKKQTLLLLVIIPNNFSATTETLVQITRNKCEIMQRCAHLQNNMSEIDLKQLDEYVFNFYERIISELQ